MRAFQGCVKLKAIRMSRKAKYIGQGEEKVMGVMEGKR